MMQVTGIILLLFFIPLTADELVLPREVTEGLTQIPPFYSNIATQEGSLQRQKLETNIVKGVGAEIPKPTVVSPAVAKEASVEDEAVKAASKPLIDSIAMNFKAPELNAKTFSLHTKKSTVQDVVALVGHLAGIEFIVDSDITGIVDGIDCDKCTAGHVLNYIAVSSTPKLALIRFMNMWRIMHFSRALNLLRVARTDLISSVFKIEYVAFDESFKAEVRKMWDMITHGPAVSPLAYMSFDDQTRKIFVHASRFHTELLADYLHQIDHAIPQIRIDAAVVLAQKDFIYNFGFNWSGIYNRQNTTAFKISDFSFAGLGGVLRDFPTPTGSVIPTNPALTVDPNNFALNLFPTSQTALIKIPFVWSGPDFNTRRLNLLLQAAESESRIRILSRPSLLTNNNETAQILIGSQIPIQTVVEDVAQGKIRNVTTINYRDTGIKVIVKPTLNRENNTIVLDIVIEDTFISSGSTKTNESGVMTDPPTISVLRSQNKVMLKNGQTGIIGGLIRKEERNEINKFPFLYQIPIFGSLFKGTHESKSDSEQLIFLTPTLIEHQPETL